jgi:hypothetical protein
VFATFVCGSSSVKQTKRKKNVAFPAGNLVTTQPTRVSHDLFCVCRLLGTHLRDGYCHCHTSAISYSDATSKLVSMFSCICSIRQERQYNLALSLGAYCIFSSRVKDSQRIVSFPVRHQLAWLLENSYSATAYAAHSRSSSAVM